MTDRTAPMAGIRPASSLVGEMDKENGNACTDGGGKVEDDCRLPFLRLFILISCIGSGVLSLGQAALEPSLSFNTVSLGSVALTTALLLVIIYRNSGGRSANQTSLTVGLYAFCALLDIMFTVMILTERQVRDIYLWFIPIPFLFLYTRGTRSCVVALVAVYIQMTFLRWLRLHLTLPSLTPGPNIRYTFFGESFSDGLLLVLLTTLAACHHHAHTKAVERLKATLREKDAANQELRRATQAKSEFLANMSHELRTPMHGIIAMSRELQDSLMPSSKASHAVAIISDCADHLMSLMSDILDFERIESNCLELESIPFSIVDESQKVIHLLQITADKKHLSLSLKMSVARPLHLGDPMRYRQVLFNLLSNAIKFTPDSGSVAVTVRNDDQDNPNEVVVAVKDTGIGIKEENVKLLFAPFSQLDSSICRKFGGSGLGLAISRRLCSAMGGWIECESEPGHGSTFTCRFLLPVVDSVDQAKKAKQEEEERDGNVQDKFPGLKVLLVEDNSINQKVGKRMLNALGCTVTVADNGEECLHILEEKTYDHGFDIVLMDCQMPVMDGFQATEHIRAVEAQRLQETGGAPTRIRPLPIVALTASATKEYAQRCLEVGMSDVLFKPLRREALGAALRKWQPNPPGHSPATAPSSC